MVDRGGPAERAGLRGGDTLIAVDGQSLVSTQGGEIFANLRPGVAIRLTYRRDARERTISVTPVENPISAQVAAADSQYRAAMRDYARSTRDVQRELERSQTERLRAQRELERVREQVRRNSGKVLDSASTQRMREALEQVQQVLEAQRSNSRLVPPVAPVAPAPPDAPVVAPGVSAPSYEVAPSGALRYSRRLGEAIITARRPGRVTVVETGDSEVVLTGGDLWVRVALSPSIAEARAGGAATAGFASARAASGVEAAGIQAVVANPRLAAALGATSGVLVLDVQPRSHADSLGIRPGDVVVSLNGSPVLSVRATPGRARAGTSAGRSTARTAVVVRARERRTLELRAPRATTPRPRR
jgi:membrane-associated protease RseP (regulator of RpoE activity)